MQKKAQIRGLFFNMDGVLVDVSRSYRRAIEETVEHFTGRQIVPGTIQRYKNTGGSLNDWKLTYDIITDTGMSTSESRVIAEFQRRYRGENWDGFIAEEPSLISIRTLDRLCTTKRIMGIITNRPNAEAQWTLNRFGWKRYFPLVVPREKQEGREKPDPFPLLHALAILDAAGHYLAPEESMYVGDTLDDMKAARSAGMCAVGLVPHYVENKREIESLLMYHGAHAVLHHPDGLPNLIDNFSSIVEMDSINDDT